MALALFRSHAKQLKPVWTLTYLEWTQPSLKTTPKTPSEHDVYFNQQVAAKLVQEIGEQAIWAKIQEICRHLDSKQKEWKNITYKTDCFKYYRASTAPASFEILNYKIIDFKDKCLNLLQIHKTLRRRTQTSYTC